jgi:hypothetical protein
MRLRILSAALSVAGLIAASYLGWAQYRFSSDVMRSDQLWPRPWPYPDEWLIRWEERISEENPARAGVIRIHGGMDTVRSRLAGWTAVALMATAIGLAPWVRWYRSGSPKPLTGERADFGDLTGPTVAPGPTQQE